MPCITPRSKRNTTYTRRKKMKEITLALTIVLSTLSFSATADFSKTDWKTTGDNAAILDSVSGLEWLSFRHTDGKSIDYVMQNLDSVYTGWRPPTTLELADMLNRVFPVTFTDGVTTVMSSMNGPEGKAFAALFGDTKDYTTDAFSRGLILDAGDVVRYAGVWYNKQAQYNNYSLSYLAGSYTQTFAHDNYAVFLVSDGGTTLSSINDPTINVNNPMAPINAGQNNINIEDVSSPSLLLAGFLPLLVRLRRKPGR